VSGEAGPIVSRVAGCGVAPQRVPQQSGNSLGAAGLAALAGSLDRPRVG
jgi:hypothetical protein